MNTQELMDAVLEHTSVIITLQEKQIPVVKSRLSNLRSRQQKSLDTFADDTDKRLEYLTLPPKQDSTTGYPRLRISLVARGQQLDIESLEPAEDF